MIYAQFSTDLQNVNSTRDQIASCTPLAESKGWQLLRVFEDAAISGAIRERPGYKKMLQAVKSGLVGVVLAERLDRLNRSQELSVKAIDGALRAIRDDMAIKSVYAMLGAVEEKKETLEAELAAVEAPALDIPEDLAALYRAQVDASPDTLSGLAPVSPDTWEVSV